MKRAPRVVLDTSVVLSALVFRGTAGRLREGWQAGAFVPLASAATVRELVRVLGYRKFALTPEEQEQLLADYLPWTEVIEVKAMTRDFSQCRDPYDVPFLELAVAGRANALVSGDRHLLAFAGSLGKCDVIDLASFRDRLLPS